MGSIAALLRTLAEAVFLAFFGPLLLFLIWLSLRAIDALAYLVPARKTDDSLPRRDAVSIVIPTWNGVDHLRRNLASVIAALEPYPGSEILVVDNASEDDTGAFLATQPDVVRALPQRTNLGFGRGSNAGFHAAKNDIVILLNNDMRVEPDFVAPLLAGFSRPDVFAVSAQIFFTNREKRREETGLTRGEWRNGRILVGHVIDDDIRETFPTFYAGGGSSAYDRRKFLEIGGFDRILEPFYLEDTDVSYMAWKRGWSVVYAPGSIVHHDHRGTIGKVFTPAYIERVLDKNYLLFAWKNVHRLGMISSHFGWLYVRLWLRWLLGPAPARPNSRALLRATLQLPQALGARWRARRLALLGDDEALKRPLGGYYRDRFLKPTNVPAKPNVLFVAPYPIEPPVHGGGVFMNQTVRQLARHAAVHLLGLLDDESERVSNETLGEVCASVELHVRWQDPPSQLGLFTPHAVRTFTHHDFAWQLQRAMYLREIDVLQLEYTHMASYAGDYATIAQFLFEHDVYFQSVASRMRKMRGLDRLSARWEYLRALRWELRALRQFDAIQVCTADNRDYLRSFAPSAPPIEDGLRAGIDVARYPFSAAEREPGTLLFVGNFRHPPNEQALRWFVDHIFPSVRREHPAARLVVVGAQAREDFAAEFAAEGIEYKGRVPEIRDEMARYAVFVCPILSGSGIRVKLLEAFAAGIPVVSTSLGAEGLARDGSIVALADSADAFASETLRLLRDPAAAQVMAETARREVETQWDMAAATERLAERYRDVLATKRAALQ